MKIKNKVLNGFLLLVGSLLWWTAFAFGDGFMIVTPPGRPQVIAPAPTHLSVKYHRVKVNIDNQVATTAIDQVFKNDFDQDVEGTE